MSVTNPHDGVSVHRHCDRARAVHPAMKDIFRTVISVPTAPPPLRHTEPLFFLGSCFSDEVGGRLSKDGHSVCINPLGTTFNAASLAGTIEMLASGDRVSADDVRFCERTKLFYSFLAGTAHAHEDRDGCAASINAALAEGGRALAASSALFLTLGSAWAYAHSDGPKSTDGIVLNCHRQPQADFERRLWGVGECADELRGCRLRTTIWLSTWTSTAGVASPSADV